MSKWLNNSLYQGESRNSNDTEFGMLFSCTKNAGEDGLYKWTIKKAVLNDIDRSYIQLYLFKSNLDELASLVIGKGLITEDEKVNPKLEEFKKTLGMSDINFFNEVLRIRQTKGNLAITLTKVQDPITGNEVDRFVIIPPEKLVIFTRNKEEGYGLSSLAGFGIQKTRNETVMLNWATSILVRNQVGSIFGLPPLIVNNAMTKGIINDIQKYNISHANGGQKAQLVSYTHPNKDEIVSVDNMIEQNQKLQQLLKGNQRVISTNLETKVVTLEESKESDQFYNHISETYPFYSAKLAGISPSMSINPKNINRATASQEYKAMIQKTIIPLNSTLSQIAQTMYDIWLMTTNQNDSTRIRLAPPKENLDVGLDPTNIWQLVDKKIITIDEARKMLNLPPLAS
jgi:hypothetical protein